MVEFDKTLLAELRIGPEAVLLDNGNELTLCSRLLNRVLTSGRAQGRVLGLSEMADLTTRALILMTGNALGVSADDVRRVLVSNLDARTEDPERRKVTYPDFLATVIKPCRGEILQHILTIWRWGRQHHGEITKGEALMSFDTYTRWVRDPLLALRCKDPVSRIDELKMTDPKRELQAAVFREWMHAHASDDVKKAGLETVPVTANRLSTKVCSLIDPKHADNNNKKVIHTLTAWRGVHVAGFVLESNALNKGKHSTTKYWLTRREELKEEADAE